MATTIERLSLYGQPLFDRESILARFRAARSIDDLCPLLELEDNYVAVYESERGVFIVSSLYALAPYFYALRRGVFLHADTIHGLVCQGMIDLTWNFEAVADHLALEHVVGDDTLARGVRPVPQGAILHFDGTRLTEKRFRFDSFSRPPPAPRKIPEHLVELFLDGLRAGQEGMKRALLTGSAGLDSRVNLAGLLHLGYRPELCVMGDRASRDVEMVFAMAKAFSLPVNHVPLELGDYLDGAVEAALITNGVKPVYHWHSYILAKKAGYGLDERVVTGNNGEHVRAAGLDAGTLSRALDALSRVDRRLFTDAVQRRLFKKRTAILLREDELARCEPGFRGYYGSERQNAKFMSVLPDMSFLSRADAFVLEQRRRGFQSCGLKLFSRGFTPYSAYLRKSWIDQGWYLAPGWRVGSRWHRWAVDRLCPRLLDFPEDKEVDRMRLRERPLRWMPPFRTMHKTRNIPYSDGEALTRRPEILALLRDNATELEGLMPKSLVLELAREHEERGGRARLVGTLLGMAVWRAAVKGAAATYGSRPPLPSEQVSAPSLR
jgi:asparagine synthase (glutamine-hydrolysing)